LDDFGVFSYATSLAAIGTVLLTAGLSGLAIKIFVNEAEHQGRNMTALVVLRECLAILAYAVLLALSATAGEGTVVAATAVALVALFARALDASEFWFQSRAQSGKTAPIRMGVVIVMLFLRVILAVAGVGLHVFLVLYVLEAVLISSLMLTRYLLDKRSPRFRAIAPRDPIRLVRRSWILALSGLAAQVNTRGDIIVIQALLGSAAVGIYSAAARLSEMLYFLPAVFMTATFPRLLQIRKSFGARSAEYAKELQTSYDRACWAGIGIAVALYVVGPWLLTSLYGQRYAEASAVLQIHVLALPFVFMGAVFSKWIIAEDLLIASLLRHTFGAVLNISLNLLWVPSVGVMGSAWATVVSYIVAAYLSCFVGKSTRFPALQMSLALVAPVRYIASRLNNRKPERGQ